MLKSVYKVLLTCSLLIVAAATYLFVARLQEQSQQRQRQERVLNANCAKIQLRSGKVLLVFSHRGLLRGMGDIDKSDFPVRSLLLPQGSQFQARDRHWGATYTVKTIDPDGLTIYFKADGAATSGLWSSSGIVKLLWK